MLVDAKLADMPGVIDYAADVLSSLIKGSFPYEVKELENRGIDPSGYIKEASKAMLGPADVDLTTLDPRLTPRERQTVEASKAVAKALSDGRLQSTPEDAPSTSKWANDIKAEQAVVQTKANYLG